MEFLNQANQYFVLEQYTEASKQYTNAVAKASEKNLFNAFFGRGRCMVLLNDYNNAVSDFCECLSIQNDDQLSYYYLGLSLFKLAKQNNDISKAKESHKCLLKAARGKLKQDRFEKDLNKAIKLLEKLEPKIKVSNEVNDNNNDVNNNNVKKDEENDIDMKDNNNNNKDKDKDKDQKNNNNVNNKKLNETEIENKPKEKPITFRDTWYQKSDRINFTLYAKNLTEKDVNITFSKNSMICKLNLPDGRTYTRNVDLFDSIKPNECSYSVSKYKINVILIKENQHNENWKSLEKNIEKAHVPSPWTTNKNWEDVDKFASKELEKEKPEGDEALQSLFSKIYKDADDDQRRAMIKSFQTSNGTVLSTNWKDVKDKDYEGKDKVLPTGQTVHKWEY